MTPEIIYVVFVFVFGVVLVGLCVRCMEKDLQKDGELIHSRDSERWKWYEYKMLCRCGASVRVRRSFLNNIVSGR